MTEHAEKKIDKPRKPSRLARKRAARLASVQCLYQILMTGQGAGSAVSDYLSHHAGFDMDGDVYVSPDEPMFTRIVHGVTGRREDLDEMIKGCLSGGREPGRLEPLLLAVLRAGAYELLQEVEIDAPIIISDYVEVTKGFYEGAEPSLVNAVLDKLGKILRDS